MVAAHKADSVCETTGTVVVDVNDDDDEVDDGANDDGQGDDNDSNISYEEIVEYVVEYVEETENDDDEEEEEEEEENNGGGEEEEEEENSDDASVTVDEAIVDAAAAAFANKDRLSATSLEDSKVATKMFHAWYHDSPVKDHDKEKNEKANEKDTPKTAHKINAPPLVVVGGSGSRHETKKITQEDDSVQHQISSPTNNSSSSGSSNKENNNDDEDHDGDATAAPSGGVASVANQHLSVADNKCSSTSNNKSTTATTVSPKPSIPLVKTTTTTTTRSNPSSYPYSPSAAAKAATNTSDCKNTNEASPPSSPSSSKNSNSMQRNILSATSRQPNNKKNNNSHDNTEHKNSSNNSNSGVTTTRPLSIPSWKKQQKNNNTSTDTNTSKNSAPKSPPTTTIVSVEKNQGCSNNNSSKTSTTTSLASSAIQTAAWKMKQAQPNNNHADTNSNDPHKDKQRGGGGKVEEPELSHKRHVFALPWKHHQQDQQQHQQQQQSPRRNGRSRAVSAEDDDDGNASVSSQASSSSKKRFALSVWKPKVAVAAAALPKPTKVSPYSRSNHDNDDDHDDSKDDPHELSYSNDLFTSAWHQPEDGGSTRSISLDDSSSMMSSSSIRDNNKNKSTALTNPSRSNSKADEGEDDFSPSSSFVLEIEEEDSVMNGGASVSSLSQQQQRKPWGMDRNVVSQSLGANKNRLAAFSAHYMNNNSNNKSTSSISTADSTAGGGGGLPAWKAKLFQSNSSISSSVQNNSSSSTKFWNSATFAATADPVAGAPVPFWKTKNGTSSTLNNNNSNNNNNNNTSGASTQERDTGTPSWKDKLQNMNQKLHENVNQVITAAATAATHYNANAAVDKCPSTETSNVQQNGTLSALRNQSSKTCTSLRGSASTANKALTPMAVAPAWKANVTKKMYQPNSTSDDVTSSNVQAGQSQNTSSSKVSLPVWMQPKKAKGSDELDKATSNSSKSKLEDLSMLNKGTFVRNYEHKMGKPQTASPSETKTVTEDQTSPKSQDGLPQDPSEKSPIPATGTRPEPDSLWAKQTAVASPKIVASEANIATTEQNSPKSPNPPKEKTSYKSLDNPHRLSPTSVSTLPSLPETPKGREKNVHFNARTIAKSLEQQHDDATDASMQQLNKAPKSPYSRYKGKVSHYLADRGPKSPFSRRKQMPSGPIETDDDHLDNSTRSNSRHVTEDQHERNVPKSPFARGKQTVSHIMSSAFGGTKKKSQSNGAINVSKHGSSPHAQKPANLLPAPISLDDDDDESEKKPKASTARFLPNSPFAFDSSGDGENRKQGVSPMKLKTASPAGTSETMNATKRSVAGKQEGSTLFPTSSNAMHKTKAEDETVAIKPRWTARAGPNSSVASDASTTSVTSRHSNGDTATKDRHAQKAATITLNKKTLGLPGQVKLDESVKTSEKRAPGSKALKDSSSMTTITSNLKTTSSSSASRAGKYSPAFSSPEIHVENKGISAKSPVQPMKITTVPSWRTAATTTDPVPRPVIDSEMLPPWVKESDIMEIPRTKNLSSPKGNSTNSNVRRYGKSATTGRPEQIGSSTSASPPTRHKYVVDQWKKP